MIMMLSYVCISKYIIAEKQIKMLELEALFVLVSVLFYTSLATFTIFTTEKYFWESL